MQTEDKPDTEDEKSTFPEFALDDARIESPPARKWLFIFSVIAFAYTRSGVVIEFARTATGKVGIEIPGGLYITGLSEEILLQGLGFVILFFFARYYWHEFMFHISTQPINEMFDGQLPKAFKKGEWHVMSQFIGKYIDVEKTRTTPTHPPIGVLVFLRDFIVWVTFYFALPLTAMCATSTTAFRLAIIFLVGLGVLLFFFLRHVRRQNRKSKK